MTKDKLNNVRVEIERLLKAMNQLENNETPRLIGQDYYYFSQPVARGAIRRASMDLTRALAELRKPN